MGDEENLAHLIEKTEAWNTSRDISNDDEVIVFDIYLDIENFDLHMELDFEKDAENPINKEKDIKFLDVKNLNS